MRAGCWVCCGMVVLLVLPGCVSKSKYDALLAENEKQKDKIDELGTQVDEARLSASALRAQLKGEQDGLGAFQGGAGSRDQEIAVLTQRLRGLEGQIQTLLNTPRVPAIVTTPAALEETPAVALPPAVVAALQDLAAREPALEFDARTGRCRFTSDVLFQTASDTVRPEFEALLKRFAAIFSGVGKGLNLRIEGHTDGQAIRNLGTRTAHPTNWHLAAHRAIAVLRVLYQAGIDEDRVTVVGYGSQRPIADNRTADGRSRNRRVEIFVVGGSASRTDRVAETGSMGGE